MTDPRVPVTLLTGFLGAGKTTLLNAVLSDSSTGRVAVIVNEFGEAGLDHDLIESTGDDDVSLMKSGCLCCSLKGELSKTIAGLLLRREQGELDFDKIVVETTGLADPGPIVQTLVSDRFLARSVRTDGIVTLVDAVNAPNTLDTQFEAVSQVALADLIVLSKSDLASPQQLTALEARLKAINPGARMIHSVKGDGTARAIWGLIALRQGVEAGDVLAWTSAKPSAQALPSNLSGFASAQPVVMTATPHDGRIVTASIVLDKPLDGVMFGRWLERLLGQRGHQMLRTKGIVFINDSPKPFVFHGVQSIFEPPVRLENWTGEGRQSRIVIIARDISLRRLERELEKLKTPSSTSLAR